MLIEEDIDLVALDLGHSKDPGDDGNDDEDGPELMM